MTKKVKPLKRNQQEQKDAAARFNGKATTNLGDLLKAVVEKKDK